VTDFSTFAVDVQQWQRETFPGGSALGAANHLLEEALELVADLERYGETGDENALGQAGEEAADVLLLLIAVAGLVGFDLMDEAHRKMEKNRARTWETVPNERGYRKHIEGNQS
jgi:NTP pyrophosphatase (non-canonical NTP hydrolase)